MRYKVYIEVIAHFNTEGKITPQSIIWKGRLLEVDQILDVRRAASLKAGGLGIRYNIRIGNHTTFMWLDENRWFVESKEDVGMDDYAK